MSSSYARVVVGAFVLLTPPANAATLIIERLFRNQVKLSVVDHEHPGASYLLERAQKLGNFEPAGVILNSAAYPADTRETVYRARAIMPAAAEYIRKARIVEGSKQADVVRWFELLGEFGLLSTIKYMSALEPQNSVANGKFVAMTGEDAALTGAMKFHDGGLELDGSSFVSIRPGLSSNLTELSIVTFFQAECGATGLLVGSDGGEGRVGPAFWVGGDPYIGFDPENLSFTVSANALAHAQPGFRRASTFNWGNRLAPQAALATCSLDRIAVQADIDREYRLAINGHEQIANPGDEWRIGSRLDNSLGFRGTVFFVAIFDKALRSDQFEALQRAYRTTIGRAIPFPKTQVVIEGDSLSEEAFGTEYGHWLHTESNWRGRFVKRNIARYGETTSQILDEFSTEVPRPAGGNNYLFFWAGRNDLPNSSAAEVFGRLQAYWKRARDYGYKVAAFTVIPAKYEEEKSDIRARREELNAMIRQSIGDYDSLFDVEQIAVLRDPGNLTYFKPDGVHLTAEGSKAIAKRINEILIP